MLSKEDIQSGLTTSVFGRKLFLFETIDSTNACAKTLAETGIDEGAVISSDFQSSGRGRMGRSWLSAPGESLLASVIVRPPIERESSHYITFYGAVAIARALECVTGSPFECKWPNDVLVNKKKVCGILVENSFHHERLEFSIIGFGINITQRSFPSPLHETATSLSLALGRTFERTTILRHVLVELEGLYEDLRTWKFSRIAEEWNRRCTMFGRQITIAMPDRTVSGTALRLQADGGLLIHTQAGEMAVYAGDVTVVSQQRE
jgi:BirA family biotin operon repressor/biotin-[acetyl-CoA-carboxylase] ligase